MQRSRDQWAKIVEMFEHNGETHEAFCARPHLPVWLFLYGFVGRRGNRSRHPLHSDSSAAASVSNGAVRARPLSSTESSCSTRLSAASSRA